MTNLSNDVQIFIHFTQNSHIPTTNIRQSRWNSTCRYDMMTFYDYFWEYVVL